MSEARERLEEALCETDERGYRFVNATISAADLRELLAESDRLRSLVDEAVKVVEPFAACLPTHDADRDEDDDPWGERFVAVSAHCVNFDDEHLTVEDFRAARSLLTKMKEG